MESYNPQNNKEVEKNESYERHNAFIERALSVLGNSSIAVGGGLILASAYELITNEKAGQLLIGQLGDRVPHLLYRALEHWDSIPLYLRSAAALGIFLSGQSLKETVDENEDDE